MSAVYSSIIYYTIYLYALQYFIIKLYILLTNLWFFMEFPQITHFTEIYYFKTAKKVMNISFIS